jgi:hypothetical protein
MHQPARKLTDADNDDERMMAFVKPAMQIAREKELRERYRSF